MLRRTAQIRNFTLSFDLRSLSVTPQSGELADKCLDCDRLGFDTCDKTRKPYIYHCHMGLSEAITPICEGDEIIGYMMMGQILCDGDRDLVEAAILATSAQNIPERGEFYAGLSQLRSVDRAFVASALNVMSMCVCYLHSNRIIERRSEDFATRLRTYVDRHYTEPLSVAELCRRLYISKNPLCVKRCVAYPSLGNGVEKLR